MRTLRGLPGLTAGLVAERDPAQPLLTLRDGPARVELSGATVENWVAKTANLLTDSAGSPARVGLLLPLHWQAVTLLLGAVAARAVAAVASGPDGVADCGAAFTTAGQAAAVLSAGVDEVYAVSTAPFGGRVADLPADLVAMGLLDAGRELPVHGDRYGGLPATTWHVELDGVPPRPLPSLDLGPADRVLTVAPPGSVVGLRPGLLAPLHAGAAVVLLVGEVTGSALSAACNQEGITAVVGADVPGVRRLDGPVR